MLESTDGLRALEAARQATTPPGRGTCATTSRPRRCARRGDIVRGRGPGGAAPEGALAAVRHGHGEPALHRGEVHVPGAGALHRRGGALPVPLHARPDLVRRRHAGALRGRHGLRPGRARGRRPPALRMAARIALSQAFCGSWDAWIDTIPETVWEDRGFPNFIIGVGCAMVLDWAGCMLTEQGREVVVKALADKALPRIQQSLMKHDYMWYSNQGAWDVYGAIVFSVAIASRWPHGDMFLDRTMEILNGIVDRYIAEDGGSFEGTDYQLHTMAFAMLAAEAFGRLRGRPASEVASASLSRSVELPPHHGERGPPSRARPAPGRRRPGRRPMAAHCVALLLRLTGGRELEPLLALLLPRVEPDMSMRLDNPALLVFGPESLSGGSRHAGLPGPSGFGPPHLFPADAGGSVRVVLAGCGVKDAGHSHEDRGSLIVEAFGRSLLNEVGMIDYEIAEHVLLKDARYHCVACPGRSTHCPGRCCRRHEPWSLRHGRPAAPRGRGGGARVGTRGARGIAEHREPAARGDAPHRQLRPSRRSGGHGDLQHHRDDRRSDGRLARAGRTGRRRHPPAVAAGQVAGDGQHVQCGLASPPGPR